MPINQTDVYFSAYAESLDRRRDGTDPAGLSTPKYITEADTFSLANQNKTFIESAFDTVASIPKFIGVSLISGVNQLYNIPSDIGNFFGGDFATSDTSDVIAAIDSDFSQFYEEHKEGADLAGFIVSSIVPGTAGVKILNAGQKSLEAAIGAKKFSEGTGRALGLLVPSAKKNLDLAIKEVVTTGTATSITQGNALRSVGAGIGQGVYEAFAFETAVAATLFNSPVLENQDFGDLLANVAFSGGIFGVASGGIQAVKASFKLKKVANATELEARPWTSVAEAEPASKSYEKLALRFEELDVMNRTPFPKGISAERKSTLVSAKQRKQATIEGTIRKEFSSLTNGDEEMAEVLFETFKRADVGEQHSAFIGLEEVTRVSERSKVAKDLAKLEKRIAKGKEKEGDVEAFLDAVVTNSYTRSWGEQAGKVTSLPPLRTSVVDTLRQGEKIVVTPAKVTAGKNSWKFDAKSMFPLRKGRGQQLKKKGKVYDPTKASPLAAQARYIWASRLPAFKPTVLDPLAIHVDDIPLMEKALLEIAPDDLKHVQFQGLKKGEEIGDSLQDFLAHKKIEMAVKMAEPTSLKKGAATLPSQEHIASVLNVKTSFLSGEILKDTSAAYNLKDILAMQDFAEEFTKKLVKQGARKKKDGIIELWNVPQTMRLTYDSSPFKGINGHVVENMTIIKEQQKLYNQGTTRASSNILREDFDKFEDITSDRVLGGAVPSGAGAKLFTAASNNYGSLGATMESIGHQTSRVAEKFKERARATLEPLLVKLGNDQEAAVEFAVLNAKLRGIRGEYGLNAAGDAFEPVVLLRWAEDAEVAAAAGKRAPKRPRLANADMPLHIPIQKEATQKLIKAHMEINGTSINHLAGVRSAQGAQFNRSPDAFYPIPVNPNDFPHFAIVTDGSVTSGNHSTTLFASSEQELASMIKKMEKDPRFTIHTKAEAERYYADRGQWDFEKTLSSNYMDAAKERLGASASATVPTDPKKIANDFLAWHMQRQTGLVREAVSAKYEVQIRELKNLGEEFTNIATSKFGKDVLSKRASQEAVHNPYEDYVKTMLGIKKTENYPWWVNLNTMVDEAVSKVLKKATVAVESAKTPEQMAEVNAMLKKAGYKGATYDEAMEIFANSKPARGVLSTTVQKANSILATVVLRLDMLNAANNAISANILLGAETKAIIRAIGRGDKEAAGALAAITRIKVPGTDQTMFSTKKLIANSMAKFGKDTPDMQFYKDHGFVTTISAQYKSTLDDLTFDGTEAVATWSNRIDATHKKLSKLADKGERWTGNRLAEEFNRFVAADVMKQMTDVAVARNLMTAKEQLAYINTFVNRTQGNYLAAQRPMAFHGPVGQAIGLFQTYQFNLMQQLLRHVGEGHGKDAMTLLGLQGAVHGMNGLPAFNAVNTHIVGTASGNTEHKDAYTALYGTVGKEAGDWLMYGLASNMFLHPDLKVNLYTRGDINPRHLTILPTDPSQVAIVQATGKVLGNMYETFKKLKVGGDVSQTLLQGLEHNGLSRPLAGLAQALEGLDNPEQASYSTSKQGNVIAANDFLSLMNLPRLVGGKPLDEAIALDATFRYKGYAAKDRARRGILGEAIKTTMIAGQDPTDEQLEGFAVEYAKAGGKQEQFNDWATDLYKTANLSQANKIQQSLSSPFMQQMQTLMGGEPLRDFTDD